MNTAHCMPKGGCREACEVPKLFNDSRHDLITNNREITTPLWPLLREAIVGCRS